MSLTITTFDKKFDKKTPAFDYLAEAKFNPKAIAEIIRCELSNLRSGTAHTKDRSEVRGGGKKPWKQKGTGRARHGSTRSPIWVGGGVTFGPRNTRNWKLSINKSARISAIKGIIKDRLLESNVYVFADKFNFAKTKDFVAVTEEFLKKTKGKLSHSLIIYTTEDKEMLSGVVNTEAKMVNVSHLRVHKLSQAVNYIFTPKAKEVLETRLQTKTK
jgi:large subunit ribosomal protein L4